MLEDVHVAAYSPSPPSATMRRPFASRAAVFPSSGCGWLTELHAASLEVRAELFDLGRRRVQPAAT